MLGSLRYENTAVSGTTFVVWSPSQFHGAHSDAAGTSQSLSPNGTICSPR